MSGAMGVIRFFYRLVVGVWMGGLLCFGAVLAPALFRVLTPEQAGSVVREVFPSLDVFALVAGVMLVALSVAHDGVPRSWLHRIRVVVLSVMFGCAAVSFWWVTPKMEALRRQANDSVSALPKEDPVRRQFGALHGVSATLMLAELAFGLGALALGPRSRRGEVARRSTSAA